MELTIETGLEVDGRWMASVPELSGVHAYGTTEADAVNAVRALALRALADRVENGEAVPNELSFSLVRAA